MQELLSHDTKDSIYAIYERIAGSLEQSGFNPPKFTDFLRYAAMCSEHCTRINANALDYAEALLEVRHMTGQLLRTETEAQQRIYVACTALEADCGSKEYKELVYSQGKLLQAHIQLPYEAMMNYAMSFVMGYSKMLEQGVVYVAWAKVLEQRQRVLAAKEREARAILELQAIADGKATKQAVANVTDKLTNKLGGKQSG
jgi:hypothetical protein